MLARRTIISAVSLTAALFANSALASPFTLSGIAGGALTAGDLTGWVSFPTLNGGNAERVYIGPLNMTVTDQGPGGGTTQQTVYCTDIFDNFQSGGKYNLTTPGLTTLPTIKINQLNGLLTHAPTSLANLTDPAAGGAAIQAAIWEIINESATFGYSVNQPAFKVTQMDSDGVNFYADVQTFLDNVSGTDGVNGIVWGANPNAAISEYVPTNPTNNQSFSFLGLNGGGNELPVPEPAALSLLGVGLVGLATLRRNRAPKR